MPEEDICDHSVILIEYINVILDKEFLNPQTLNASFALVLIRQ